MKNQMRRLFILLGFSYIMVSCTTILYVAPRQTECTEGAGNPCYLIRHKPEGNWVIHEKSIDGLEYEQGFSYKIKVKKAGNGVSLNGTEIDYTVVEVLEKTDATDDILPEDLQSKEWTLESMRVSETIFTPEDATPTITFSDDAKISGFAGCNRFFGSYAVSGRVITFSNLGATKMFCDEAMSLEDAYLKLLSGERRALFSDSKLILTGDDGNQMIFRYK
jgi:heat shock protein HslJ